MRMKKEQIWNEKRLAAAAALWLLAVVCISRAGVRDVFAQENGTEASGGADSGVLEDNSAEGLTLEGEESPGTYTMEEGWSLDEEQSAEGVEVYRQDLYEDAEETSTISCSYMETNYSRQEYEQLRDMLTNNLLYSNVNAQITTSAVYTLSMDYLYIVLVDDSSEDYRDIYHYVVGDYQCFCVQVREYRAEAELAEAQETDTPREIGQKVAEGFAWN